jgi:hypothetical protein
VNNNGICYGSHKREAKRKTYWWIALQCGTWYLLEGTKNDKRLYYSSFQTTNQQNFPEPTVFGRLHDLTTKPCHAKKPIYLLTHIWQEISRRNGNEDIGGTTKKICSEYTKSTKKF